MREGDERGGFEECRPKSKRTKMIRNLYPYALRMTL